MIRPPPSSTLFPYTTLFRSILERVQSKRAQLDQALAAGVDVPQTHYPRTAAEARAAAEEIGLPVLVKPEHPVGDRKSTRLNSSHRCISYAVFCLKKKKQTYSFIRPRMLSATTTSAPPSHTISCCYS